LPPLSSEPEPQCWSARAASLCFVAGAGRVVEPRWPGEQLVMSAQRGDVESITALLSGSHPHVRRFAHTLCATPQDAEDAAQEALIILYRKIGTLRASAALASWMFRIVRNECIRRARVALRHNHHVAPDGVVRSAEDAVLERLESSGSRQRSRPCLRISAAF
jgi:DNA-directed RNA polymerase specialized sigma24 family protein